MELNLEMFFLVYKLVLSEEFFIVKLEILYLVLKVLLDGKFMMYLYLVLMREFSVVFVVVEFIINCNLVSCKGIFI